MSTILAENTHKIYIYRIVVCWQALSGPQLAPKPPPIQTIPSSGSRVPHETQNLSPKQADRCGLAEKATMAINRGGANWRVFPLLNR
jgi:hypothetical protein